MITANVIHRVFRIKHGAATATAFTLDVDGKQYLVTARHVVDDIDGIATLEILSNNSWIPLETKLVGHADGEIDITVLAANSRLTPADLPLEASSAGLIYGQDVFFLGFPYGIQGKIIFGDDGYPMPLVKKALVSSMDASVYLLDGHNNPGFSGGPVVFTHGGSSQLKVAAVISGFQYVEEPIFESGAETPLVYRDNTGIIVSYSVDYAMRLIQNRPMGFQL